MPPLIIIVFMKRNSFCASSFFRFSSGNGLHCITLLTGSTLKLPVFWSSRKLTSLRGTGASALPPLTIFHSLSALQPWLDCTQMRHQPRRIRRRLRYCIPAQHRRSRMTRPPALPPCLLRASAPRNKFYYCSCHRRCFAATAVGGIRIGSGDCNMHAIQHKCAMRCIQQKGQEEEDGGDLLSHWLGV